MASELFSNDTVIVSEVHNEVCLLDLTPWLLQKERQISHLFRLMHSRLKQSKQIPAPAAPLGADHRNVLFSFLPKSEVVNSGF